MALYWLGRHKGLLANAKTQLEVPTGELQFVGIGDSTRLAFTAMRTDEESVQAVAAVGRDVDLRVRYLLRAVSVDCRRLHDLV